MEEFEVQNRRMDEMLAIGLRLVGRFFWALVLLALIGAAAEFALQLFGLPAPETRLGFDLHDFGMRGLEDFSVLSMVAGFARLVLDKVMFAAGIALVASAFTGAQTGVGAAIRIGFRRFVPVLLASLIQSLLGGIVVAISFGVASMTSSVVGIVVAAPLALYLFLTFFFTLEAIVIEDLGTVAALRRSAELTRSVRLELLFGLLLPLMVVAGLILIVAVFFVGFVDMFVPVGAAGTLLAGFLLATWVLTCSVAAFFHLRFRKDATHGTTEAPAPT